MTTPVILEILLHFTTALYTCYSLTPPTAPANETSKAKASSGDSLGRYKLITWGRYLAYLQASAGATWFSRSLWLRDHQQSSSVHNSTLVLFVYILGFLLAWSGASTRLYCHHLLGSFFTFDLSVQDGHKILDTGAYGIVRHPAYTGSLILGIGVHLIYFVGNPLIGERGKLWGVANLIWVMAIGVVSIDRIRELSLLS